MDLMDSAWELASPALPQPLTVALRLHEMHTTAEASTTEQHCITYGFFFFPTMHLSFPGFNQLQEKPNLEADRSPLPNLTSRRQVTQKQRPCCRHCQPTRAGSDFPNQSP